MGIFHGSNEVVAVGDIAIGGTDVQEVYAGATKVWPDGPVGPGPNFCPLPPLDQPLADYTIDGALNEWTDPCGMESKGWIKSNTGVPTFNTTTADFTRTPDMTYYFDSLPEHGTWNVGDTIHWRMHYNLAQNDYRHRIRLDSKSGTQLAFDSTWSFATPLVIDYTIQASDVTNGGFRFFTYSGSPNTGSVEVSKMEIWIT